MDHLCQKWWSSEILEIDQCDVIYNIHSLKHNNLESFEQDIHMCIYIYTWKIIWHNGMGAIFQEPRSWIRNHPTSFAHLTVPFPIREGWHQPLLFRLCWHPSCTIFVTVTSTADYGVPFKRTFVSNTDVANNTNKVTWKISQQRDVVFQPPSFQQVPVSSSFYLHRKSRVWNNFGTGWSQKLFTNNSYESWDIFKRLSKHVLRTSWRYLKQNNHMICKHLYWGLQTPGN